MFVFLSYWPSGASIYQFEQYLQFTKDGKFQKFDYGADENTEIYGTENPPVYDLGKVRFPVGLFYGKQDVLYLEKVRGNSLEHNIVIFFFLEQPTIA